jgi:anaerobic selenocysteine-containing dehydrogenase
MPVERQQTFCRICEAHCGLIAEVERPSGRVLRLVPDRDHPVSKGYCCAQGLRLGEVHHDPDRLNFPRKRTAHGFERISWAQALREIGDMLRALRAVHGPRSIGMYRGNPSFFSYQHYLFATAFLDALGSPNAFSSVSIDSNPKFFVATHMYGHPLIQPIVDIGHNELFVCLGSNPAISQMSILEMPNALGRLREVVERGGRVISVDPRRTETARRVGEHWFIRPGTDAYLLLAVLHVLVVELGVSGSAIQRHAIGLEALCAAAQGWTPERAARVTGIDAERIRELGLAYQRANGACLYVSTGVTMGPFGTLCCWLVQALSVIAGQLDRRGGTLVARGAFDLIQLSRQRGETPRTLARGWPAVAGAFPVAALAEEIELDHPERIRALLVTGGNPLHSVPGRELERAIEKLELLVAIDVYPSETCARAHYVLPATDMLEHSDFPFGWMLLQATPHVQFSERVVAPLAERREEWRIFSDLALAAGLPWGASPCQFLPHLNRWLRHVPGRPELTPDHLLSLLLWWGGKVSLDQLRRHPAGLLLEPLAPEDFLGQRVPTADGKVDLAPAAVLADLPRLAAREAELSAIPAGRLRMIGLRERRTHNSWLHNLERPDLASGNRAQLHPADAARLGIRDGSEVFVRGAAGELRLPVQLSDDLLEGVIAVPHGWGHERAHTSRASALPGQNFNTAIPSGAPHMEPPSGQAIMLGHSVEVRPVEVRPVEVRPVEVRSIELTAVDAAVEETTGTS